MNRPWFAIVWFMIWGLFQAYAVASIFAGTWQKPETFPEEAYFNLIYRDMFFIPLYLLTAGLLLGRHWLGSILAFECGMYQGKRAEADERNRNFPVDPKSINAMVLLHAHIDHSGKAANSQFCQNLHLREQGG